MALELNPVDLILLLIDLALPEQRQCNNSVIAV
jgi:hypothetical protein